MSTSLIPPAPKFIDNCSGWLLLRETFIFENIDSSYQHSDKHKILYSNNKVKIKAPHTNSVKEVDNIMPGGFKALGQDEGL